MTKKIKVSSYISLVKSAIAIFGILFFSACNKNQSEKLGMIGNKSDVVETYEKTCGGIPKIEKCVINEDYMDEPEISGFSIKTPRFLAMPFYTKETEYDKFSPEIKTMYTNLYNDEVVMEKMLDGKVWSKERFSGMVSRQVARCKDSYSFTGFMVIDEYASTDKENDVVVGCQFLINPKKDGNPQDAAEISYLYAGPYHRDGKEGKKHVGYENAGGVMFCAQFLCTYFKYYFKVEATSRLDNVGSVGILRKLGFVGGEIEIKYDALRQNYLFDFSQNNFKVS